MQHTTIVRYSWILLALAVACGDSDAVGTDGFAGAAGEGGSGGDGGTGGESTFGHECSSSEECGPFTCIPDEYYGFPVLAEGELGTCERGQDNNAMVFLSEPSILEAGQNALEGPFDFVEAWTFSPGQEPEWGPAYAFSATGSARPFAFAMLEHLDATVGEETVSCGLLFDFEHGLVSGGELLDGGGYNGTVLCPGPELRMRVVYEVAEANPTP